MNQDPITPDMNAEIRRLRCIAEDKSHNEKLVHRSLPPFPVTDRKYTKTGAQNTTAFLIRTTTWTLYNHMWILHLVSLYGRYDVMQAGKNGYIPPPILPLHPWLTLLTSLLSPHHD